MLQRAPEQRIQQTLLAKEVTELVHGGMYSQPSHSPVILIQTTSAEAGVTSALRVTDLLYSADRKKLKATDILSAMKEDPRLRVISRSDLTETTVVKLAAVHRLTDSGCMSLFSPDESYSNSGPRSTSQDDVQSAGSLRQ